MPPFPEIHNIHRFVGRIEIDGNLYAQHPADPHGHIAVTAEVKIELQGVEQNHQACVRPTKNGQIFIAVIHTRAECIRQKHFLGKPKHKKRETARNPLPVRLFRVKRPKLRQHLAVIYNGAGDKLREKGHKQRILGQRAVRHLAPVSIHDEGNLLKGKKADPQRQKDAPQNKIGSAHAVHGVEEEVKILKVKQHAQIERHRQNHDRPARQPEMFSGQQSVEQKVSCNAADHDQQIGQIKIAIEPQRHGSQKHFCPPGPPLLQQDVIAEQAYGKKYEYKNIRIK